MGNTERLVKKTGLYFIGNLSSKIVQAAILPIYAFFVTPEDLGSFDYAQVWANILAPVFFLAIWEAVLKFIIAENDDNKIKVRTSTIVAFVGLAIPVSAIILFIINLFVKIKFLSYIFIMLLFMGVAQIWQYFARSLHNNTNYVVASVLGTIINFLLLIILVCVLKLGCRGLVTAFVVGQMAIVIVVESKTRVLKHFSLKDVDFSVLKSMLKYSVPLVLNLTSLWLLNGFGRTIITDRLGADANGLYTFAFKFGALLSTLGSVISMAMCEEAILKINDPDISEFFSKVNTNLFRLFLAISAIIMPAITVFYYLIGDTGYFASLGLVALFLVNAMFNIMSTNIGSVFPATNNTHLTFTTTLAGAIAMIIVSYLLIDIWGIKGVAVGQICGSFVMMFTRWLYAVKLINLKIKIVSLLPMTFVFIAVSAVSVNIGAIANIFLFAVSVLIVFLINKSDFLRILNLIKTKIFKR